MDEAATPSRGTRSTGRIGGSDVSCRRDTAAPDRRRIQALPLRRCRASRVDERSGLRHPSIDFFECLRDLGPPPLVNGGIELPLELGPREPQRFQRPQSFRIANGPRVFLGALVLQIFHALLNPRLSVDQSFARVSHAMISSLSPAALAGP